jgi:hypothetical protein
MIKFVSCYKILHPPTIFVRLSSKNNVGQDIEKKKESLLTGAGMQ